MIQLKTLALEVENQTNILKECYKRVEELLDNNPQLESLSFKIDTIIDDSDFITYISELEVNGNITTFEDDHLDDHLDEHGDLSITIPVGMIADSLKVIYKGQDEVDITLKRIF